MVVNMSSEDHPLQDFFILLSFILQDSLLRCKFRARILFPGNSSISGFLRSESCLFPNGLFGTVPLEQSLLNKGVKYLNETLYG